MVRKSVLRNGVRVLTEPMPQMVSATIGIWVENGSRYEHERRQNGVSHFIEHLLFKGTKKRTAAQIAEGRKQKGVKLNYPETVAYIANYVVEGAREGKSVAELMKSARSVLKTSDVMAGVPELIHTIQVEATFPDGTKLVTVHDPVQ